MKTAKTSTGKTIINPDRDHIFTAFYQAAKDYGIPANIIVDNGKDYRCKASAVHQLVKELKYELFRK